MNTFPYKGIMLILVIFTSVINLALYFEIREISTKIDNFQTVESDNPNLIRSIVKWLI